MKRPLQRYLITVKYPCDSSSNISEVSWIEVLAVSEAQAIHRAKLKASSRIEAFLTPPLFSSSTNPTPL